MNTMHKAIETMEKSIESMKKPMDSANKKFWLQHSANYRFQFQNVANSQEKCPRLKQQIKKQPSKNLLHPVPGIFQANV